MLFSLLLAGLFALIAPARPLPGDDCRGQTQDGKKTGVWKCFYADGKVQTEGPYANDHKQGAWKLYHTNGQLAGEGNYAQDQEKGKWKFYDEEGHLLLEQDY